MRVVIDTNVLVSWLISKSDTMQGLRHAWETGRFTLLVSDELISELREVLDRPRLQRYLKPGEAPSFIEAVRQGSFAIMIQPPYPAAPDPDDAYLLAMLRDGTADVLVSGDKALVALERFENADILTPRAFAAYLEHIA